MPFLPDVPTVAESGVPGYWTYSWNGIVAPAKTPPNIVAQINKVINSAIATPEIQKRFRELIMEPRTGTPEDLQKIYDADVLMWRKVITEAKIQPNVTGHEEVFDEHRSEDQPCDRAGSPAARTSIRWSGRRASISPRPTGWSICSE